ncbi:hypothetical protein C0Q70_05236 [Pomacea canaliculata]|uniref:Uncharacterized protein n=1 Tax=Pomacea canaliculata TaxID=400727 RepID=A0A2T7PKP2_POMCA|nr:hypothetical protein C0Q70_05236 [Pomacea canaliculata]
MRKELASFEKQLQQQQRNSGDVSCVISSAKRTVCPAGSWSSSDTKLNLQGSMLPCIRPGAANTAPTPDGSHPY